MNEALEIKVLNISRDVKENSTCLHFTLITKKCSTNFKVDLCLGYDESAYYRVKIKEISFENSNKQLEYTDVFGVHVDINISDKFLNSFEDETLKQTTLIDILNYEIIMELEKFLSNATYNDEKPFEDYSPYKKTLQFKADNGKHYRAVFNKFEKNAWWFFEESRPYTFARIATLAGKHNSTPEFLFKQHEDSAERAALT